MPNATLKVISITLCIALAALNALALSPETSDFRVYLTGASLAIALCLLMASLLIRGEKAERESRTETARPAPVPVPAEGNRAEAEIVSFLAIFQERGRLIDFLMDDITTYDDAQVGAAARVVHQGCKAALQEHFRIGPIREESEGSSVTISAGYAADEYRLIGKINGPGPFSGTLLHHGWKINSLNLPRLVRADPERLPTIAPAEVELK
jgi:hypothetical protein